MSHSKDGKVVGKSRKASDGSGQTERRCGLCGKTERLTRTECCGNWICDDEDEYVAFSYAGNSCDRNHRRFTLCGYHHAEGHKGSWKDCAACRGAFETELYVHYGTNEYNFEKLENPPAFEPNRCATCGAAINLGGENYSQRGSEYWCEICSARNLEKLFSRGSGTTPGPHPQPSTPPRKPRGKRRGGKKGAGRG
jgi:hypothetical protein